MARTRFKCHVCIHTTVNADIQASDALHLQSLTSTLSSANVCSMHGANTRLEWFALAQMKCRQSVYTSKPLFRKSACSNLWSSITPLAWLFRPFWEQEYGQNWPTALCIQWFERDGRLINFYHELPSCPCTLSQAIADVGRFAPMDGCNMYGNSECTDFYGAEHCVVSLQLTCAVEMLCTLCNANSLCSSGGSQQTCCYDPRGYLMHSNDHLFYQETDAFITPATPFRFHFSIYMHKSKNSRAGPLTKAHTRIVSHLTCRRSAIISTIALATIYAASIRDTVRSHLFAHRKHYAHLGEFFFWRRSTSSCQNYRPVTIGAVYGLQHFLTFDAAQYTFNGRGDYVLLHADHPTQALTVHIRVEQPPPTPCK